MMTCAQKVGLETVQPRCYRSSFRTSLSRRNTVLSHMFTWVAHGHAHTYTQSLAVGLLNYAAGSLLSAFQEMSLELEYRNTFITVQARTFRCQGATGMTQSYVLRNVRLAFRFPAQTREVQCTGWCCLCRLSPNQPFIFLLL